MPSFVVAQHHHHNTAILPVPPEVFQLSVFLQFRAYSNAFQSVDMVQWIAVLSSKSLLALHRHLQSAADAVDSANPI